MEHLGGGYSKLPPKAF
jgi:hypothetical protein